MHGASLLAHQGGWDEILLVASPVLVFSGLLVMARRRALALAYQDRLTPTSGSEPGRSSEIDDPETGSEPEAG